MDSKDEIEEISKIYSSRRMTGAVQKYNLESLRAAVPYLIGDTVLEMGCGDGTWTYTLLNYFKKVEVVDASKQLLDNISKLPGESIKCHCSLFEEFTPTHKFDTIIAAHILEHVDNPIKTLYDATRWLTKDGRIIIVVPNAKSIHRQVGVLMRILNNTTQLSDSDPCHRS